jgi:WD40 repeat protein
MLRKLLDYVVRMLFGADVFISYSREDGLDYASALANRLATRFVCRFDLWGTTPGSRLPPELIRAIRHTAVFVLIGTSGAGKSKQVYQEVTEYIKTGRPLVPIDVDRSLQQSALWNLIGGLPITYEVANAPAPSDRTDSRIANTFSFRTRDQRLRLLSSVMLGIFAVLALGAGVASTFAARQVTRAREANAQRVRADALAQVNRLVATASADSTQFPERALIATVEASRRAQAAGQNDLPIVVQGLLSILQQLGGRGFRTAGSVGALEFSPDGAVLAAASNEAGVESWNLRSPSAPAIPRRSLGEYPDFLRVSANGRWLVARAMREVSVSALPECTESACALHWRARPDQGGYVPVVAVQPDGRVGIVGHDRVLYVLDLDASSAPRLVKRQFVQPSSITAVSITSMGDLAATGAEDGRLRLWNLRTTGTLPLRVIESGFGSTPMEHTRGVSRVGISSNGRWLIARPSEPLSFEPGDRSGRLWDLIRRGERSITLHAKAEFKDFAFCPDSHCLVTTALHDSLFWVLPGSLSGAAQPAPLIAEDSAVSAPAISADGMWLAGITEHDRLAVWSLSADRPSGAVQLLAAPEEASVVAFDAVGQQLAAAGRSGSVRVWSLSALPDVRGPHTAQARMSYGDSVSYPHVSRSGEWMMTNGELTNSEGLIALWNPGLLKGRPEYEIRVPRNLWRPSATLDPSGHWLLIRSCSAENSCEARIRSLTPEGLSGLGRVIADRLAGGPDPAIFSPSGDWVAAELTDGSVTLTAVGFPKQLPIVAVASGKKAGFRDKLFSPDGRWLLISRFAGPSALLKYTDGHWQKVRDLEPAGIPPESDVQISGDSGWLILRRERGGTPQIRRLEDDQVLTFDPTHTAPARVAYARNFSVLATFAPEEKPGAVSLWSVRKASTKAVRLASLHAPVEFSGITFSPDGRWLLGTSRNDNSQFVVWDIHEPIKPSTPRLLIGRGAKPQRDFEFSPGGRFLIVREINDPVVELWDLLAAKPVAYSIELTGHTSGIESVHFRDDDKWLVTLSSDGTGRLWDLTRGLNEMPSTQLRGHRYGVQWAYFLGDRSALITASYSDGTIRAWPLRSEILRKAAREVAGRNLSLAEWNQLLPDEPYRATFVDLPSDCAAVRSLVHRARRLMEDGASADARALISQAETLVVHCGSAELSNMVCWWGTLYGFASLVGDAGEEAVRLAPDNASYRDTRGVNRAANGNLSGASEDFIDFLERGTQVSGAVRRRREGWLEQLRQQHNPIDEHELAQLRYD